MPTVKLHVPDLDLEGEQRIEDAVLALEGVFAAVASHEDRCLEIDFEDDLVSLDELIQAAGRAGFTARFTG